MLTIPTYPGCAFTDNPLAHNKDTCNLHEVGLPLACFDGVSNKPTQIFSNKQWSVAGSGHLRCA